MCLGGRGDVKSAMFRKGKDMNLTSALKDWLIVNCSVAEDATDEEFKQAAGTALAKGTLSVIKFTELSTEKEVKQAVEAANKLDALLMTQTKLVDLMTSRFEAEDAAAAAQKTANDARVAAEAAVTTDSKSIGTDDAQVVQPTKLAKLVAGIGGRPIETQGDTVDVRVKAVVERYDDTKTTLLYPEQTKGEKPHPMAGKPVKDFSDVFSEVGGGRMLNVPTDRDKAVVGAYAKFLCESTITGSRSLAFMKMPEHDKELLLFAMNEMPWGGVGPNNTDSRWADIANRKLTDLEQKALIDDSTSGGLEAAPIVFDDNVIQTPLLHGELFPLVNVVPLDRGRRVEGVSTGTVTGSWGGVDDTAISLFNTASYVSAFDTTIFRWEGAVRIGLDFLGDTPIDFGAHISAQYGERLLEDLDDVIATGNGTTQPEGIMNKSGATTIAFGGTTTIGNYESMRFGVAKPEHRSTVKASAVFCGTETSYQRVRAIPVGASDARRLGGMDYDSYSWMQRPYKINESLTNAQIFYAILARYRMYRRRGFSMRQSVEGDTLIRNNERLLVAMARYGGQQERGATVAITTTGEA